DHRVVTAGQRAGLPQLPLEAAFGQVAAVERAGGALRQAPAREHGDAEHLGVGGYVGVDGAGDPHVRSSLGWATNAPPAPAPWSRAGRTSGSGTRRHAIR